MSTPQYVEYPLTFEHLQRQGVLAQVHDTTTRIGRGVYLTTVCAGTDQGRQAMRDSLRPQKEHERFKLLPLNLEKPGKGYLTGEGWWVL